VLTQLAGLNADGMSGPKSAAAARTRALR